MPTPSELLKLAKAGKSIFEKKEVVKPNRGLKNLASIRQSHSEAQLKAYRNTLLEEGWEKTPEGEFSSVNTSEIGKKREEEGDSSTFYVSDDNMRQGRLDESRIRLTTWEEPEALSESDIFGNTSAAAVAKRRNMRRSTRRRSSRRRSTRRRTYRK